MRTQEAVILAPQQGGLAVLPEGELKVGKLLGLVERFPVEVPRIFRRPVGDQVGYSRKTRIFWSRFLRLRLAVVLTAPRSRLQG